MAEWSMHQTSNQRITIRRGSNSVKGKPVFSLRKKLHTYCSVLGWFKEWIWVCVYKLITSFTIKLNELCINLNTTDAPITKQNTIGAPVCTILNTSRQRNNRLFSPIPIFSKRTVNIFTSHKKKTSSSQSDYFCAFPQKCKLAVEKPM